MILAYYCWSSVRKFGTGDVVGDVGVESDNIDGEVGVERAERPINETIVVVVVADIVGEFVGEFVDELSKECTEDGDADRELLILTKT